jgi:radical SAM superfamily enzyme YgiQ (UPF0313 family)
LGTALGDTGKEKIMKVCLVRCPCINLPYPPPIGLAYISAFLKSAGHEVSIFDLNVEVFHAIDEEKKKKYSCHEITDLLRLADDIFLDYGSLIDSYVDKILEKQPRIVGFSVWDTNVVFTLKLARKIKNADKSIIIVLGGPECFPKWSGESLSREDCVDVVIYGEGEAAMRELADYVDLTGRVGLHKGMIINKGFHTFNGGQREPLMNLDDMPFPDFSGFSLDKYMGQGLPILFNRGCPRKCTYCSVPGTTPQYRWRSAVSIFEEIRHQLSLHPGIRRPFLSSSPALNSNLRELSKLCDLIIDSGIKVEWSGFAIIDKNMDLGLLNKMKKAGCGCLNFGLESGSQKIVDKMAKYYKLEDAEKNIRDAYSVGIETVVNFIIGFPGEEEDDFQQTLDFISRSRHYISSIGSAEVCWIGMYSRCYDHPEEFGVTIHAPGHDWSSQDNNHQIRQERKKKFKAFLDLNGFSIAFPRLPE